MSLPCFIGDEVSAMAWRLTGVRVHVPGKTEVLDTVRRSCEQASLVLISASMAQQLPTAELHELLAQITPPVVIVPDVRGHTPLPELATQLRRQLGVLE
jgi:vacuolar-type H+-ATPase subunit F/Vma7